MKKEFLRCLTGTAIAVLVFAVAGCGGGSSGSTTAGAITLIGEIGGGSASGLTQAYTAGGVEYVRIIATFTDGTTATGDIGDDGSFSISISEETLASATSIVLSAVNSANVFVATMILGDGTGVLTLEGLTGAINIGTFTCTSGLCTGSLSLAQIMAAMGQTDWDENATDCALFGRANSCDGGCDWEGGFDPLNHTTTFMNALDLIDCLTARGNLSTIQSDDQLILQFSRGLNTTSITNGIIVSADGVAVNNYTVSPLEGPFGYDRIQITPIGIWSGTVSVTFTSALQDTEGNAYVGSDSCTYTVTSALASISAFKLQEEDECGFRGSFGMCPNVATDGDCDCWPDAEDNCPDDPNPDQIPFCTDEFRAACGSIGEFYPALCGCFGGAGINSSILGDLAACCQVVCAETKTPPAGCGFMGMGSATGGDTSTEAGGGGTGPAGMGGTCTANADCAWMGTGATCVDTPMGFKDCQQVGATACTCEYYGGYMGGESNDNCDRDTECEGGPCMRMQGTCDPYWQGGTFNEDVGGGTATPPPSTPPPGGGGEGPQGPTGIACVAGYCDFMGSWCSNSAPVMACPGVMTCVVHTCYKTCTTAAECQM